MKKLFKSVLVALGVLPAVFLADDVMAASKSAIAKHSRSAAQVQQQSTLLLEESRGIVQIQQGKKFGGQIDALMPFYGNMTEFLYTDLQAFQSGSQYQTLSGGLGGRSFMHDAVYGAYAFYDFQTLNNNFTYNRYNIGLERLGEAWEWRTNLYYYANAGVKNMTDLGQTGVFIDGTSINYNHLYDIEQSYNFGGDLEVGRTLGLKALRGYVAYYNYGNEISGGRVRATYDIDERWQLISSGQYDAARGWLAYGGVNFWIGKVKTKTGTALDHLRDPIVRDMTVAVKKIDSYNAPDTDARAIYFASPTGSATGTGAENDPITIDAAISKSNAGDFIYLDNGTYNLESVINLKANQTLWGTGTNLNITSAQGKTFLLKQGTGLSPVLNAGATTLKNEELCQLLSGSGCAIYVTNTNQYGGFTLDGQNVNANRQGFLVGGSAVVTPTISNVTIQNFSASDLATPSSGIRVNNPSATVSLTNVSLNNNYNGVRVLHGNVDISGTSIFTNNIYGIAVGGTSTLGVVTDANATIHGNTTITSNSSSVNAAIAQFGGNLVISNAVINGNVTSGAYAITVANNGTVTIDNSTINTNQGGVVLQSGGQLTMDHATVTGSTSASAVAGILVDGATTKATISNSTITNNYVGISMQNGAILILNDSSVSNNSSNGINMSGTSTATMNGVSQIKNNGGYGLFAQDSAQITVNAGASILANNTSADNYQIVVNNNATVIVINPTTLQGELNVSTNNGGTITVNGDDFNFNTTPATCTINNGEGTCISS